MENRDLVDVLFKDSLRALQKNAEVRKENSGNGQIESWFKVRIGVQKFTMRTKEAEEPEVVA